ncbi:glucan endo-1,3-beta-glucosidase 6-like [Telopea speciosissima]|uniref:glucan endo-1,3-beta-glucosidase 6-like n=1 Tax=Telopea speciosissima TaxID=54955 RepID=UPI001CC55ECF|nr:glucan endo-1,3-beta-glucosidase 6-like [Telopea speciosissima]
MGQLPLVFGVVSLLCLVVSVSSIGANWGTQATHPLPPDSVVGMLKNNGFQKVKLFDPEPGVLRALGKSGIEVMVGIPNEMLATLASSVKAAETWVEKNVSTHITSNTVNIRYVAVGNEPFLETYNGSFLTTTFPALQNIQSALIKAGLASQVKVTVPLNADVYQSSTGLPSGGDFRSDIHDLMVAIVKFLSDNGGPFTVNIYPFISLYDNPDFPVNYAFFDSTSPQLTDSNGNSYYNMFDANLDTLVWALQKNGYGNLPIIVGEIGWPTDGDKNANLQYAQRFNQGFMNHILTGNGTPMRPGPIDAYLFSLIDEDDKSITPGNFERHWGIFYFDGLAKYQLNLGTTNSSNLVRATGVHYLEKKWCVMSPSASMDDPQVAPSVSYACGRADCTSLGYGTSCSGLDARGNISYAFNSYYQRLNQDDTACKFPNLSIITKTDPTTGICRFEIMIQPITSKGQQRFGSLQKRVNLIVFMFLTFLTCL